MKCLMAILLFLSISTFAEEKTFEEKESEFIDYSNIQNVLKKDKLVKEVAKKKKLVKKIKEQRKEISKEKYFYPSKGDFYGLLSEYWLVKNAQILKWDFPKPNFGISSAFKALLEKLGFFNIKFKVLVVNSPNIVHFALPGNKGETIFILSLPFIRNLDLTKVDISILMLENFLRIQEGYFIQNVGIEDIPFGENFFGNKIKPESWEKYLKSYSNIIFEEGFNFQQQFEVTKKMDTLLKSDPSLWNAYFRLLGKIEKFVQVDLLFKGLLKIYPSPELQLKWLMPKKKI